MSIVVSGQDEEYDNISLTHLDSITLNRNPLLDAKAAIKTYGDDDLIKTTILRFNQSLHSYLRVTVGNTDYNLVKHDGIQNTGTTIIK